MTDHSGPDSKDPDPRGPNGSPEGEFGGADRGTETFSMDLDKLLEPIPGEDPAGENLRYEDTFDRIQEARQEDDTALPHGVWERSMKKAEWIKVRDLCLEALGSQTKDLQVAVWLLEALSHIEGFTGLKEGLKFIFRLLEKFWDELHPKMEEDDLEYRVAPFVWMDQKLSLKIKLIPITRPETDEASSYSYADWESAVNLENQARRDKAVMEAAIAEGKVTRAKFLGSVMFTSRSYYMALIKDLGASIDLVKALDSFLDERCNEDSPGLVHLRETLEEIKGKVNDFIMEKREDEASGLVETEDVEEDEEADEMQAEVATGIGGIRSRAQAYRMLSMAADYLLMTEPHSPTPYLVRRAVSWGNMTLTELLAELVADNHDLNQIYELLGIRPADVRGPGGE